MNMPTFPIQPNVYNCAILLIGLIFQSNTWAENDKPEEPQRLPEPLTLGYVLSLAIGEHPEIIKAQAQIDLQKAKRDSIESINGFTATFQAQAKYIEPSEISLDQSSNDSQLHLYLTKRIYDFGRSSAASGAADAEVEASDALYTDARNRHRVAIMQRYFDVLIADLRFIRDNEAMSIAYIRLDRARKHKVQGQISDIEIFEKERIYQLSRRNVFESRALQQGTRARLANMINRPGQLSSEVAEPDLGDLGRPVPSIEALQKLALDNNPYLSALKRQVLAAKKRLAEARAGRWPVVGSEVKLSEYERASGNYNEYQAMIVLDIPLLDGGKVAAHIANRQAELRVSVAKLTAKRMELQEAVLDLWQQLNMYKVRRDEMLALAEYRELYLDRSRALYEMEVQADLGDAMVEVSTARLEFAKTNYQTALVWAQLDALTGSSLSESK